MGQHQSDPVTRWLLAGAGNAGHVAIGVTLLMLGLAWAGMCGASGQPQMEVFGLGVAGLGGVVFAIGRPRRVIIGAVLAPSATIIAGAAVLLMLGIPAQQKPDLSPAGKDDYGLVDWSSAPTLTPQRRAPQKLAPLPNSGKPDPEEAAMRATLAKRGVPIRSATRNPDGTWRLVIGAPPARQHEAETLDPAETSRAIEVGRLRAMARASNGGEPGLSFPANLFGSLPPDTQVHFIGMYEADKKLLKEMPDGVHGNRYGEIHVDVRTTSPVVLVLSAYEPANWVLNLAAGAQVRGVILAGYDQQSVEGLPYDVPVRKFFHDPAGRNYFYAYKADTPETEHAEDYIGVMTGLPTANLHRYLSYYGVDTVIDDNGGGAGALPRRTPPPGSPPAPSQDIFGALPPETRVQYFGAFMVDHKLQKPLPPGQEGNTYGELKVAVSLLTPVVLVLASNEPVRWVVQPVAGAQIKGVILGGYYRNTVTGLPEGVPVDDLSSHAWNDDYLYCGHTTVHELQSLETRLSRLTGLGADHIYHHIVFYGTDVALDAGGVSDLPLPQDLNAAIMQDSMPLSSIPANVPRPAGAAPDSRVYPVTKFVPDRFQPLPGNASPDGVGPTR